MGQQSWVSSITQIDDGRLVTYGFDQEQIIRDFSYEEMVFLLLTGRKPTGVEAELLRLVIVSHCSHGITGQSTIAVRMAADTGAPLLNAILGGFMVGAGKFHQGGLQAAMEELIALKEHQNVLHYIEQKRVGGERIIGYGHRFHKRDPRARLLVERARTLTSQGAYMSIACEVEEALAAQKGIYMNIEAAGGAILLDLGFKPQIGSLIIMLGRAPMLAAAYFERMESSPSPFPQLKVSDVVSDLGDTAVGEGSF